jgi:hypothetical protein
MHGPTNPKFLRNVANLYQNPRSHIPENSIPPYFSFPASHCLSPPHVSFLRHSNKDRIEKNLLFSERSRLTISNGGYVDSKTRPHIVYYSQDEMEGGWKPVVPRNVLALRCQIFCFKMVKVNNTRSRTVVTG